MKDVDDLRLHLHRLGERLRSCIPDAPPSMSIPIPPTTGSLGGLPIRRPSRAYALDHRFSASCWSWVMKRVNVALKAVS